MGIIRILHLVDNFSPGGAQNIIGNICKYAPEGYESHIVVLNHKEPRMQFDDLKAMVHGFTPKIIRPFNWLRSIESVIKDIKPDYINVNLQFSALVFHFVFRKLCSAPVNVAIHAIPEQISFFWYRLFSVMNSYAASYTVEDKISAAALIKLGVQPEKVHHIPIGTDFFESARNVSFVTPKGKIPLFLNISRMVKTKGQHLLLLAFSMYKRRGGLGMLVIGGYGTEERNLKAYCMKLGISDYVSFIGKVDDPFSVLAKATAYVTVATDEGMGVIIYDAMAAGLPIIGFNAGTITEIVVDGINGRLVKNYDVEALSGLMADFDVNYECYADIGQTNSIKIKESHTNKCICEMYYKLFESQINNK